MNAAATLSPPCARPKGVPANFKGKPFRHAWTYRDAAGSVLGHVARYDADGRKECVPFFHPNGNGWEMGAAPEPRPLFGLDTLAGDTVHVVEGEKCAAALQALGLPCVTSPGGANAAHKSDWTPLERFRRVFLLPDHDPAGEGFVCSVAGILAGLAGAREVHVCRLPGLPDGGDVVDWLMEWVIDWDGYAPVPREAGDDLSGILREFIEECAERVPPEWTVTHAAEGALLEWETPVPLEAAMVPPWPRDVFPEPVQDFVDALARSTETPPELPALMVLAVLATAAQGKYRVRIKPDYFEPLCLWTCCSLPSGTRKSAVQMTAAAPLVAWEKAERDRLQPVIEEAESRKKTLQARVDTLRKQATRSEGQGFDLLMQQIMDAEAEMPVVPALPQVWTADVTPENLAVIMADNGECMAILSDESGIFENMAGRYNRGVSNLDVFLQGHAATPVRVNRGSRPPVFLHCPRLTIGMCPQPDVVQSLSDKPGFRGRGLLARFLYAMPVSNLGRRPVNMEPVPDAVAERYRGTVAAMLGHPYGQNAEEEACPHILRLSSDSLDRWNGFSQTMEAGMAEGATFAHITDWASKLPGAVARIAAILHVTRYAHGQPWKHEIAAPEMDAALRLADTLGKHALITFDAMGADAALDDARVLLGWIRRTRLNTFTRRDAQAAHKHRFQRAHQVDAPLEVLAERHYIRQRVNPQVRQPGRPSLAYDVNPAAFHG